MPDQIEIKQFSRDDLVTDQDPRWCPGCGDYSILSQIRKVLPEIGVPKENIVWVSGIGCSSRFPYYINTYGIHGIHGRAAAIASGVKLANPDLSVWVATGDGDALSIGGNHFIHLFRRNINVNMVLFNNQIYGLTKGQYSPTSEHGKVTKSSPLGSIEHPFNPVALAIASGATYVARSMDRDPHHLAEMIKKAASHNGTSFIEVYQNCNIFNDGVFLHLTDKKVRADNVIYLEDGQPLIYGKNKDKGLMFNGVTFDVIDLSEGGKESEIMVYNEREYDSSIAYALSKLTYNPNLPTPMGVFRHIDVELYEKQMVQQIEDDIAKKGKGDLKSLLTSGESWSVN
ncbi:MAG: 2-oxoacid:ferredoxin oxidoreductase subunit beta [Calditrichia bacterium]